MKKLFGAWNPEETRRFHAPVKSIMSCNRSLNSGVKKYVIY